MTESGIFAALNRNEVRPRTEGTAALTPGVFSTVA